MIRLRQTIERGMRHRWLGLLFVVLFCLLMALMFMHEMHAGHSTATELGEFCLGLTIMFGVMVLIRVGWLAVVRLVLRLPARAPPSQPVATACSPRSLFVTFASPLRL